MPYKNSIYQQFQWYLLAYLGNTWPWRITSLVGESYQNIFSTSPEFSHYKKCSQKNVKVCQIQKFSNSLSFTFNVLVWVTREHDFLLGKKWNKNLKSSRPTQHVTLLCYVMLMCVTRIASYQSTKPLPGTTPGTLFWYKWSACPSLTRTHTKKYAENFR